MGSRRESFEFRPETINSTGYNLGVPDGYVNTVYSTRIGDRWPLPSTQRRDGCPLILAVSGKRALS